MTRTAAPTASARQRRAAPALPSALPTEPPIVQLAARARDLQPYSGTSFPGPIDLYLDANEGPLTRRPPRVSPDPTGDRSRRYPSTTTLERELAASLGVSPDRVIVTSGGDDAIDRACRATLEPGRTLVLPVPTFEMIDRSAAAAGASIIRVPWTGPYPLRAVTDAIDARTGMIALVSPNNPTGAVATRRDLLALSKAAGRALVLVDLAYTEFADEDLTPIAAGLHNTVIIRTFSKAYGLAGLRVGYAIGPAPVIRAMRAMGSPYPVAGPSLAAARAALRDSGSLRRSCDRVRTERTSLTALLIQLGASPQPSQANFVLAEFADAAHVWSELAALGIGVRRYRPGSGLERCLRISCPGSRPAFTRLCKALRGVLAASAAKRSPSTASPSKLRSMSNDRTHG